MVSAGRVGIVHFTITGPGEIDIEALRRSGIIQDSLGFPYDQALSRSSSQTLSGIGRPTNVSLVGGSSGTIPKRPSTIMS